jgi:ribosomal protein L1
MDEETLNLSVRKFLKKVGITAQREIETSVREAIESGKLTGDETLNARVTLTVDGVELSHEIDGELALK